MRMRSRCLRGNKCQGNIELPLRILIVIAYDCIMIQEETLGRIIKNPLAKQ